MTCDHEYQPRRGQRIKPRMANSLLVANHELALRNELRAKDLTIRRQAEQLASLRQQLVDAAARERRAREGKS